LQPACFVYFSKHHGKASISNLYGAVYDIAVLKADEFVVTQIVACEYEAEYSQNCKSHIQWISCK